MPERALRLAESSHAEYADIRIVRFENVALEVRGGRLTKAVSGVDEGAGVRVLLRGAWGFGHTNDLSGSGLREAVAAAVAVASTGRSSGDRGIELAPVRVETGEVR